VVVMPRGSPAAAPRHIGPTAAPRPPPSGAAARPASVPGATPLRPGAEPPSTGLGPWAVPSRAGARLPWTGAPAHPSARVGAGPRDRARRGPRVVRGHHRDGERRLLV